MLRLLHFLLFGFWRTLPRCPSEDKDRASDFFSTRCRAQASPMCVSLLCRQHCREKCKCESVYGGST